MLIRFISRAVLVAACCTIAHMAHAQEPIDYTFDGTAGEVAEETAGEVAEETASEVAEGTPAETAAATVQPVYAVPPQQIPTLAYNYYYPAPGSGYMPARLYLSPRPVPLHVGYTWITYQPLAPHEFLWRHQRTYYRVHPDGGVTYTRLNWR